MLVLQFFGSNSFKNIQKFVHTKPKEKIHVDLKCCELNDVKADFLSFFFFRDGPLVKSVARDVNVTQSTATRVGERTGSVSVTPRGLVSDLFYDTCPSNIKESLKHRYP